MSKLVSTHYCIRAASVSLVRWLRSLRQDAVRLRMKRHVVEGGYLGTWCGRETTCGVGDGERGRCGCGREVVCGVCVW